MTYNNFPEMHSLEFAIVMKQNLSLGKKTKNSVLE